MPHFQVHRLCWFRAAIAISLGVLTPVIRPAASQEPAPKSGRAVRGTVFDSIAGRPLYGAAVQVVAVRSTLAPWTTTTDSAGRYRVSGLPAGQYTVGFYHDALTTLGLDAVTRTIELAADTLATVDLAIPSSAMVRALRCGQSDDFTQGMLVGFVRDAANRAPIAGTKVTVHWRAFALDSANYRVVAERSTATIDADGAMLVCNLPVDAPLDLLVTAPGHREVAGSVVTVPAMGIGRLDVLLADSALSTGSAVIRGKVTRESGRPVGSGRVVIESLGREVAVQNGEFVAANVPAGTWVAEARVIGVEPQDVLVTASDSAVTTTAIEVSNGPQRLDAVTVIGKPTRDLRVLDDVLRRKRVGSGTTFLPGHPALRSATFTSDVMREARGFSYQGPNKILGRVRGFERCANVAVYVNDVRQSDGFDGLDHIAPIEEVLAIETWADLDFAPVQYRRL
ncbi:MAG: carboxypeptidase-like regulatory domain-containing protein [Gemmatimonadaceae bacterium]|nr:carboxypeptidase-like regulatory domain-containing protein [Gemmatimonadaceae bacterium]